MTNNQNYTAKKRYHTLAFRLGIFLPLITIALLSANVVYAETCEKPACKRNEIYHEGICHRSTGYPTYIRSQDKTVCDSGWELVISRGVCVKIRCNGVTLQPIKPRPGVVGSKQTEIYEKLACKPKETYRDGFCYYSTGYPTYIKTQTKAACDSDWRLDARRGVCVR